MATRILDFPYDSIPQHLDGLTGYDRVLMLVRVEGIPVGQAVVPVRDGKVIQAELRAELRRQVAYTAADSIARRNMMPDSPTGTLLSATVAVCTRERPDDLVRCLDALGKLPDLGQELLVIDNNPSTERTRLVVKQYPRVRYVCEPRRGLDNARNRALQEANGEVVAFIDDDAVADTGWLNALLLAFEDPRVQCVTGLTMPFEMETNAQEVFESVTGFSLRGFTRRAFQSPPLNPLAAGGVGAGANMAIRRALLEEIGPFDPALDAGTASCSGGDHEYFTRVLRAGHRIVYEPAALNWHRHRRTWKELCDAMYGYGVGVYAAWTSSLLSGNEWGVLGLAASWLFRAQLPRIVRALLRPSRERPADILWAELRGCAVGPFAYFKARRTARQSLQ
ncbi:MAG: glycosyltransferase [Burkholderiales bacterium]|jgi:GT2 family glycosyltransferase